MNSFIPHELCMVKYHDLDEAVRTCFEVSDIAQRLLGSKSVALGKSDFLSAFRQVPLKRKCWKWLILAAEDPITGILKYFVDKCLPF